MNQAIKQSQKQWLLLKSQISMAKPNLKPVPSISEQSDEMLVSAFQAGEDSAFQILLARHQKPVYNFLYKFIRNEEATEEAFQEVFLRVVRSINEYRPSAKFTTWLYTIARNYCIDLSRKEKFRRHYSLSDKSSEDSDRLEDRIADDSAGADNTSSANELERILYEVLDDLNPEQREVFLMREVQGLQFDEIAKITKTSSNTVKSRMRYALQGIQKKLAEKGIVDGK